MHWRYNGFFVFTSHACVAEYRTSRRSVVLLFNCQIFLHWSIHDYCFNIFRILTICCKQCEQNDKADSRTWEPRKPGTQIQTVSLHLRRKREHAATSTSRPCSIHKFDSQILRKLESDGLEVYERKLLRAKIRTCSIPM